MNKVWQISPKADEAFLVSHAAYTPVLLSILWNRGIRTKEQITSFLEDTYEQSAFDPFLFVDMEKAISLLISHIKKRNKITIYGDYDADGVSSSVLMADILRILKVEVDFYIPDRVTEGYGLNREALDGIISNGTKLLITVDNGIRSRAEVAFAKERGLDLIITDHHQGPELESDYPDCLIINPALPREKLPFDKLAGVGVALKFTEALLARSTLEPSLKKRINDSLFDLAALGTVADCVSLLGENRLIVKKGLEVMNESKRLGLSELVKISNIRSPKELDSWNIGYQLAPRINAAGRMDHANTAFALLMSREKDEAVKLAAELNHNNLMRQKNTESIFESVESQIAKNPGDFLLAAVYEYRPKEEHEPWNEGIIGLVSGKVTEKYYRPSIIITKSEEGYKGSGRSIPEFNISKALELSKEFLNKFGGHPLACGFSLKGDLLDSFVAAMKKFAQAELEGKDLRPKIHIDLILDFTEISTSLVDSLSTLKPYGQDNPQPIFMSKNIQIVDKLNMGMNSQHLKLRLKNGSSSILSAIGFGQSDKWSALSIADSIDICYYLDINEFNGRREVQLRIIDINKN